LHAHHVVIIDGRKIIKKTLCNPRRHNAHTKIREVQWKDSEVYIGDINTQIGRMYKQRGGFISLHPSPMKGKQNKYAHDRNCLVFWWAFRHLVGYSQRNGVSEI